MASDPMWSTVNEARLLFAAEVFLANIPSIVAELSSAKYALFVFSDKSRNEVKQKSSLIPALSDVYRKLLEVRGSLCGEKQRLSEVETQLVRSSPPKFISMEEAHPAETPSAVYTSDHRRSDFAEAENELLTEENLVTPPAAAIEAPTSASVGGANSYGASSGAAPSGDAAQTVVVLSADDLKWVRESESLLEEERDSLVRLSRETNEMEEQLEEARSLCEKMTKHVQSHKCMYETSCSELMKVKSERRQYAVIQEEWEERSKIINEAQQEMEELFALCRHEEVAIISGAVDGLRERVGISHKEIEKKKHSNEVELAVYQIAYKEQQAVVDELRDAISYLKHHQWELELIAKRQEIEKLKRNSIQRVLMSSLHMSLDTREMVAQELIEQQLDEVKEDHRMVSFVSARIGVMEARRKALVAELLRISPSESDSTRVKCALRRMRDLLKEEIIVDESTLQDDESVTSLYNRDVSLPRS
ncbi:hypothetical protein TraAM80_00407 [Trypanosoma rangeli]|uniref:Uncharacterized protein n=1 Tax=Trypanosoma rangeli TaxID=5698 RepID=A0A3S5ISM8_TRYRA|nr:uncharacterized protein TraAM80_00407 [Trypanosoma rangeli]RNF12260.1 hypothetical protein TraAM80_00407 [Trypanosoma rangeli]|eukprot:RNF12260.1 hypothetical protein TraAM80_00407 [Trypanosoma rangeli]